MPNGTPRFDEIRFDELRFAAPDIDALGADYAAIASLLDGRGPDGDRLDAALARWDALRRANLSWATMVQIRFSLDTADADAKCDRALADRLDPILKAHDDTIRARLLAGDRDALARRVGAHVVRLWEEDGRCFAPAIADALVAEAGLVARYTELTASARIAIDGTIVNLSGIRPFAESTDRALRHRAAHAKWAFFAAQGDALDGIFDAMVAARHGMARALGDENFVALGYRRMHRIDWGPEDAARYRDAIAAHVVPLFARDTERRRTAAGWDRFRAWDAPLLDLAGNPRPSGGHDALVAAGATMFARTDERIASLYRRMLAGGYLDLATRPAKAPGGFCDMFPTAGLPFIFANFNGTRDDIGVLTHEVGHAVQMFESRALPAIDTLLPTMEAAEINSMALELLTAPHAGLLVGDASAERFRRVQLLSFLELLAQCALGDHFQAEIYARPHLTPAERHAVWARLAARYTPWMDWGDVAHPAKGGGWHEVLHFFVVPFYFLDYALAACCALQFWVRASTDRRGALDDYMSLCARGGSAPFGALLEAAGLRSPFAPGVLAETVAAVASALDRLPAGGEPPPHGSR